jgi:hypothetical protein
VVALALAAAAGLACGGGSGSNGPATASEACSTLHAAAAERSARCLGGSPADWLLHIDGIELCATYDDHVRKRLVVYHPERWQGCLDQYARSCGDPDTVTCLYDVLAGQIADGEPCIDGAVCGVTSGCFNFSSVDACGAICANLSQLGETCDTWPCAVGLTCVDRICSRLRTAGEVCGGEQAILCAPPLFCDVTTSGGEGVCATHQAGEVCQADSECSVEQFCLAGACAARRALGMSCDDAPTGCVPWTACDGSTCVAGGRPGQPCTVLPGTDWPYWCMGIGFCGPYGTCDTYAWPGESCATNSCLNSVCTASEICEACR